MPVGGEGQSKLRSAQLLVGLALLLLAVGAALVASALIQEPVASDGTRRLLTLKHSSFKRELDMSDCAWHAHHPFLQQWSTFQGPEEADVVAGAPFGGVQCPMCGQRNQTVVRWSNLRELGACPACGATNRFRQLALAITQVASQALGKPVHSVRELSAAPGLSVFNTQCSGALHTLFRNHTGYVCSEYLGQEHASGEVVRGVRHEDLQRTSFPTAAVDLVVSAEVFEHIPDPYRAHAELLRILKPRGAHVFTVPFIPTRYDDVVKARLAPNGSLVWVGEPEFHGDPLRKEGVPVFVIFAQHMVDKLCQLGFRVRTLHLRIPEYGILGEGWAFQAVKP